MPREIRVKVKLMSGEWKTVEVGSDISAGEFIRQMVDQLGLSKVDQGGAPTVWSLDSKKTGRELDNAKSMEENNVSDEEELILLRKVIAGGDV